MTRDLSSLPRANLTDDDLRALGAIVSYWSLAEHQLERIIWHLIAAPGFDTADFAKIRLISATRKIDTLKKLLRLTCSAYPDTLAIGLSLATTGKHLANRRKVVMHWPASRNGVKPQIKFADTAWPFAAPQRTHLTQADLIRLAIEMGDWWLDLNRFSLLITLDGPLASLTTFHGPKPSPANFPWQTFRTIPKKPQIPTIQKPSPPPRSSRK